ncbi:putative aspartic-type endopeptidase [Hyphodiscus hymeniophilus]|uniref:Aspartic-type endopeptidase n=1 Tax=Hyphodiscus hymeniophilus TaxID=353542 RepID=A0A9P6VIS0_9HELO|nr:putative aspartic-type endopeptidase [Hyphodiscus hymeniophilus]
MPRIPHSTLLKAYKKTPLLPLVLKGARTLPSAINELRWLIEHVQQTSSENGYKRQQQKLLQLCKRRSKGEPLQYILESQPFGELDIKCRPGVLIPRPETEAYTTYLADLITSYRLNRVLSDRYCHGDDPPRIPHAAKIPRLKILDLCTGSGCIPLLLGNLLSKALTNFEIYGWDISMDAVALANENLVHNVELGHVIKSRHKRLGFELVDIFDHDDKLRDTLRKQSGHGGNGAKVDIIISNPPYISQTDFIRETTRSVRNWEPKLALVPRRLPHMETAVEFDAADVFYQRLLALHSDVFESRVLLMEVGDQAQALRVAKMAMDHCDSGNSQNTRTSNELEIWRDSPDADNGEELRVGERNILVRGNGLLSLGATATDSPVVVNSLTAASYQEASDLQNVSTYVTLTRVQGQSSLSGHYRGILRNVLFGRYGISPTTFNSNGSIFSTPITFGTETFNVIVDTGSSDTWVLADGAQCADPAGNPTNAGCNFGPQWDQKGCVAIPNENFNINYGGGAPSELGTFCTIDVTLGGITAKNQQVAAVTYAANFVPGLSGLVGFAYPALVYAFSGTNSSADNGATNQVPYNPLFTNMYKQGHVAPVFSITLSRPSPYYNNDGFIALGGLAPVATYGAWGITPIQTVSINTPAPGGYAPTTLPSPQYEWYTITPDAFLWQSGSNPVYNPNKWTAFPNPTGNLTFERQYILDSGSTFSGLSPAIADALAAKFKPPGVLNSDLTYSVPCNAVAPWLAVQIGGVIFPIDKRDMIYTQGPGDCYATTGNGDIYAPYVLGDPFMKNVMSVFDLGSGQMKFRSR